MSIFYCKKFVFFSLAIVIDSLHNHSPFVLYKNNNRYIYTFYHTAIFPMMQTLLHILV